MKYKSQRLAYPFFALSMTLVMLQIVYGFIMGFAHMGYDGLHDWLPFNVARSTHTNLLLMWLISGFMGATYYLLPEEADHEIVSEKLVWIQFIAFAATGVTAIIGFHFMWWEGRKFLEIPRPLDFLVVADVLLFLYVTGATLWKGKRKTATVMVLWFGLLSMALLYLPGMIPTDHQTHDSVWRWWVVHLWVEGVWELIMGGIMAFLLLKISGVDREVVEKWLYVIVGLTFLSGILGTGHHFYWIGFPKYWLWVGSVFSALEPFAFLGMAIWALALTKKSGRNHPNQNALLWTVGCAIMSTVGAGFLGFAHTLPQVNIWTHGTLVTAMHGHLAFWGAYGMLVLGIISYAMPTMTGRKFYDGWVASFAFWASNVGMVAMTIALAIAGISQTVLERRSGMDFLAVQKEVAPHFLGMILAASLFTTGMIAYVYNFIRYGLPNMEMVGRSAYGETKLGTGDAEAPPLAVAPDASRA
jgi:nitric oxide reductase subunit B